MQLLEWFINLYNTILAFLGDCKEFEFLNPGNLKPSYLANILRKLNALNKELQGKKTFLDCKTKIVGFINKLKYFIAQISKKNLFEFSYLSKV